MIVRSDVAHDTRVVREAVTLVAAGHQVHVVGKDVPASWHPPAGVSTGTVGARSSFDSRRPTRGQRLPAHLRAARWLLMPRHNASVWRSFLSGVRSQVASGAPDGASGPGWDVVHAHDFPVLELAAELAARWEAALVYDSHEWWSGRRREQRPTPVADRRECAMERRLGAGAAAVLTVSEGIAERFRGWGWQHVHVVRNSFPGGFPRGAGADPSAAGAPAAPKEPSGMVYAGRIGFGRDLDAAIAATSLDFPLTLIGPVDPGYAGGLKLEAGVAVLPGVAPDDVDRVLREVGLALVTLEDSCANHRLALPNKLFHAVRAGVPVVAADLPEMGRLVREHGIGTLYRPGDAGSLRRAVQQARDGYPQYVAAVRANRAQLSWEVDERRLLEVYAGLAPNRGQPGTGRAR